MKQFFKFMFASMLGFFLTLVVFFFLMIIIVVSISSASMKKEEITVEPNSILHIKLDKEFGDRTSANPFDNFDFATLKSSKALGLNDIIKNIKKAKDDENIKGIYFEIVPLLSGMASIEEIRNALIDFKESGKFIVSYGEVIPQTSYYLASVSDKIYMMPEGIMLYTGLSAQLMFFKGTLEKLEVEAQVIRHGKFKSAIEPFVNDKMSDENREQTMKYISSIWDHMTKGISESRNLTIADLNLVADSIFIRKAADAVSYGLVDSLIFYDQLIAELKQRIDVDEDDEISFISLDKYDSVAETKKKERSKNKIAVIYAQGDINSGQGDEKAIYSDDLAETIREARSDSSVKAVVMRINSPGGSALASEVILREAFLTRDVKPLIVSFGDVAASGGYYIACAAHKIVSGPTTITGSIGVFGLIPNAEKFFNNKLGITFDVAKTNYQSDFGSITRPMTAQETMIIQNQVNDIYNTFITHVANARNMTKEQVDSIGQGRVWTGLDALEIGLVDEIGGLDRAIAIAAEAANLETYKVVEYPKQKDFLTLLMEDLNSQVSQRFLKKYLGANYIIFEQLQKLENMDKIQARLPYELEIY
ncbi:MAG: signal peptide peptidase SppA [Bacteroidales bacterium]|nr:signal peptide peptidase SppA [Bacteroidales bacterium]